MKQFNDQFPVGVLACLARGLHGGAAPVWQGSGFKSRQAFRNYLAVMIFFTFTFVCVLHGTDNVSSPSSRHVYKQSDNFLVTAA